MFLAGTGNGCCGAGQRSGSSNGSCNPRKFSEKIALLTQRQAEDTAAFQEVMMDITSTRIQVQRARQARSLGTYYGGSLPNVNQIGRSISDVQGQLPCSPDNGCPTKLHPMAEWAQGEGRLSFPVRPNRKHIDNSPYRSVHPSQQLEPSLRRNWSISSPVDKSHLMHPPLTALNRTNSDSALHTSVRNTHAGDQQPLISQNRHNGFPYPVPLIEENVLEEEKPLRNTKKLPALPTGVKSHKVPGINILSSPDQQFRALNVHSALNASGSLPDLSSLHLPSPQPVGGDSHKPTACSTGHLPGTPAHLEARDDEFPMPGLSLSLQGSYSNPLLQSSHSNPNIQASLRSHSLSSSLNSTSLNLSLSNSSLQSSPSNQSLQSFLSSSSLSGLSLKSATSHCSNSSGIGGSRSCSSSSLSCSPRPISQTQVPSLRRRTPLSPLVVPTGGESRWLQSKQFSPVGSPKLSSITQGVLLNTNQLPQESRPPGYPHCQPQHEGTPAAQQHSLTEGQQQPSQEPPPHQEKSRHQQQQDQQHPQLQLPQTHNLQQLQYHHRQQYQHPNQLYQCQIQHVQTESQDLDIKQQYQRGSNHCENPQQQHLHQSQEEQHQRQQQKQQKQVYQNLPQHQLEKQRQQYQQHPHQQHDQQQAYQRQPQQNRACRQDELLLQQHQLQQVQLYQQQQTNGYQQQQHEQHQWNLQCAYPPAQSLDLNGQNMSNPQKVPTMTRKHQTQAQGRSWAHQKVPSQKDQIESTKIFSQINSLMDNNPGLYNVRISPSVAYCDTFILNHLQQESYMGLHLTPRQTQALSQQLGQLSKEPVWGDSGPQAVEGKDGGVYCGNQGPQMSLHCQNQTSADFMTDKAAYEDLSGVLPMLGFDADDFTLHNPLKIDPLDLEELNILADGDMVEDTVEGHCSNLLR
ncbi:CREB-regulated transcription coactivator 2 isoform X2 [Oncorhynchus tshawytscha]|uniref:CREB-regulated transcription coactivator 2 isoform X2 n=1 Tax=Oncorhynchus tshawytscha TaxID=74940 RepID=UPI000D0A0E82|nr:CREB-regulated transcription coactivator 2 isoform X2 [Oncorhynchus tshawytscha]